MLYTYVESVLSQHDDTTLLFEGRENPPGLSFGLFSQSASACWLDFPFDRLYRREMRMQSSPTDCQPAQIGDIVDFKLLGFIGFPIFIRLLNRPFAEKILTGFSKLPASLEPKTFPITETEAKDTIACRNFNSFSFSSVVPLLSFN